jgi:valyl-tRNA synthetase
MPHQLPKAYDPGAIEKRWAEYWVREKLFAVPSPEGNEDRAAEGGRPYAINPEHTFSLLLPPPNVTGRLHMGHMLNQTEMDIIVRWHRMRGDLTLWLPGTDHAGIATQMMVERQLASEGTDRRSLGREKFIERVWDWRRHYGGAIFDQMRRLGASVDWSREYFTMDEHLSLAVREVFVRLYDEGLIYRGKYIVNWCPRCGTAISDLETVHEETQGKLYEIKYPVVGSPGEYVTVATTRPETMLGDTAVAVNPRDERYRHLHGRAVLLPLMNREIAVILDEIAQPEFGTGVVKITPAHDPNDFAAGLRHNLPQITVIDELARMNEQAGPYAGLDRFEARDRIVADLEAQGLLAGVKDYLVPLGKCERCKTIVEPRLSTQWFVAVNKPGENGTRSLAGAAREVVENGAIRFTPENYKTIYLHWMENLHDWCISRQLWWGHRIPAWHCQECHQITVARETPERCAHCHSQQIEQDPDVLDTWFSSALLPFTTLGWPESTRDLEVFYPTSLLITGFDILFFWVARMIMMGCHFMMPPHAPHHSAGDAQLANAVPFREVYIHALVRDAERQKMSKTKGNVLDPIQVIEQYGTDATRFTLAAMASPGTDIAFNPARTEGYRAFANKIWNAARFMFMNVDRAEAAGVFSLAEFAKSKQDGEEPRPYTSRTDEGVRPHAGIAQFEAATLEDRWILSRFNRVAQEVEDALGTYRFHEASSTIYSFFWGEFCDWYLELIKPRLTNLESEKGKDEARRVLLNLVSLFEASLRLLSPFMPFITEEVWHAIYDGKPALKSIALAPYPVRDPDQVDVPAEGQMSVLQDLIASVRNIRAELKVEPRQPAPIEVHADSNVQVLVEQNRGAVERLANVEAIQFATDSLAKLPNARSTARFDVRVVYERKIDKAAECDRLQKELARLEKEKENSQRQLSNEQFLAKAPEHVVAGIRKRSEELVVLLEKTRGALSELGCGG